MARQMLTLGDKVRSNAQLPLLGQTQAAPAMDGGANLGELQAQFDAAQRRQKMAEALMSTGFIPNSGALGALAQIASTFVGKKMDRQADESMADALKRKFDADSAQAAAQDPFTVRRKQMEQIGLSPETPEGRQFLLTGSLPSETRPSDLRVFDEMTHGMSPEDQEKARRISLGLSPRASSALPFGFMKVMGDDGVERLVQTNRAKGSATPVNAAPAMTPDQLMIEANRLAQSGHPPAEVDAFVEQNLKNAGLDPVAPNPFASRPAEVTAGLKAQAQERGKVQGKSAANLPTVLANADQMLAVLDLAIKHPGRETATGLSGAIDPRNLFPSSDARNFQSVLKQLRGKSFLQAFDSLRGGGQITEAEGGKATDAIARLQTDQSDEAFLQSLNDLKSVVESAKTRAKTMASAPVAPGQIIERNGRRFRVLGGDPSDPFIEEVR